MFKKLFATRESIIYTSLIAAGVVLLTLLIILTATANDARRLVFKETKDGTYVVQDIKNVYRGGIFFKDTLVIPSEYRGKDVVAIERVECRYIKEIVIEEGIKEIRTGAFSGLVSLEKITIPASVTIIDNAGFSNCQNLVEINIVEGSKLKTIGNEAFLNCNKLTKFDVPATVTKIGDAAFKSCASLEEININFTNTEVGGSVLKNTKYANTIMQNNNGLFIEEGALLDVQPEYYQGTNIVIPSTVTVIKKGAFADLKTIKAVTISASVTEIENYAFEKCTGLQVLYFTSSNVTFASKSFSGCTSLNYKVFASEEIEAAITSKNTEYTRARSVYGEGETYYTYVYLTAEDKKADVTSKLSFDIETLEIFRMNEGVKEVFNPNKYTFTAK